MRKAAAQKSGPEPSQRPKFQKPSLLGEYIGETEVRDSINGHKVTDENDDYAFLDEDENLEDEDVVDGPGMNSLRWRRRYRRSVQDLDQDLDEGEEIRSDLHVIFRRKGATTDAGSDYREWQKILQDSSNNHAKHAKNSESDMLTKNLDIFKNFKMKLHLKSVQSQTQN